jgi:hypothetical protein
VIYCLIRDWKLAAIMACALGMGTKETMATAPIMALIYDRTFISWSFASALKKRPWMYAGLAATWIIPAMAVLAGSRSASVGSLAPLDYAPNAAWCDRALYCAYLLAAKSGFGLLRLADRSFVGERGLGRNARGAFVYLSLISLWRKPWLGFLGVWFFVILAPSSSMVPIFTEIAAEHRMYLPLVAPMVLLVVGGWMMLSRARRVHGSPGFC